MTPPNPKPVQREEKRARLERKQRARAGRAEAHKLMTRNGTPRRVNGNRLGLRKRFELDQSI